MTQQRRRDLVELQAASPDEAALVVAAKVLGAFFLRRTPSTVVVREMEGSAVVENEYELLQVLEFNSTRKRQSVIIRQPDGSIRLFCKVELFHFVLEVMSRTFSSVLSPGKVFLGLGMLVFLLAVAFYSECSLDCTVRRDCSACPS